MWYSLSYRCRSVSWHRHSYNALSTNNPTLHHPSPSSCLSVLFRSDRLLCQLCVYPLPLLHLSPPLAIWQCGECLQRLASAVSGRQLNEFNWLLSLQIYIIYMHCDTYCEAARLQVDAECR